MSVEICACSVVDNNSRWNCVLVQQFILIVGGIVCVFNRL
jgi:hypothetical protein